ncbi:MAG: glycosyltransferase family 2 protein [Acidimicrobiia bacterium]
MTASPPDPTPPGATAGPEDVTAAAPAPPVVAVVVTRNAGPFLEETLAALGSQDYPALTVLVVDAGSEHDPTARVAAALPTGFVRRLGGAPGFGGAANEALAAVDGAAFFLVCHDDVALDPDAIRIMVEEAYRSNAAIVGPKLVRADDATVLLEVGRAIDRLGGSHTGIEPDEVDQEQHDAVRDVFYVSSATMLVRVDLFHEIEGFDPEAFPGSEDLDLCWRARLAGARVMVAPDARGRHHEAADQRLEADLPDVRTVARTRVRTILSCYSIATLLWVVPFGFVLSFVEAIVYLPTHRRRAAFAGFAAWWWAFLHLGNVRRARRHAQHGRAIHDADLHELQVGAGARFGTFLTQHHADDRLQSLSERTRDSLEAVATLFRTPAAYGLLAVLALVLIGSRELLTDGVPSVGTMVDWPGVKALVAELTSAWRHTGLGSDVAGPPALGMMAGLGTVLFGGVGLAETLVVVGSFFVGAAGAYRLARGIAAGPAAAATAAVVYALVPVPRNAIANGRLGPLVLYALLPFLVLLLVRAGGFPGTAGRSRRPLLGLALGTALATAWYPPAALAVVVIALVFVIASVVSGGVVRALRALGASAVGVAGAALLLAPWTVTMLDSRDDLAALGIAYRSRLDLSQVLRFESGPAGAGLAPWGLLAAAVLAVLLARGPRLAWAIRALALVVAGDALVLLPSELSPRSAVAAPEAGLAIAAVGVAWAAAIAVGAGSEELKAAGRFAARRLLVVGAVAGVVLGGLGLAADTISGRWRAPDGSWATSLSFTQDATFEGEFRILWVGDPNVLPLDPVELDGEVSWVLTRDGPGDSRALWRAPETSADEVITDAVSVARGGSTTRLGRLLAPAGIRYVAVPLRNGPDGERGRSVPSVRTALGSQLDLTRLRSEPGLLVYENQAWAPARALTAREVPNGDVRPLPSAVRTDLSDATPIGDAPAPAGTALLAEAYDAGWTAASNGTTLTHQRAFGWVNGWTNPNQGTVVFAHDGQGMRYALLGGELILWIVAIVWWLRGRNRERAARLAQARRARLERAAVPADFALQADEAGFSELDGFWDQS